VLLIGLDEYSHWFGRGKRADLLAMQLDTQEIGVRCAAIEVKAVRATDTGEAFAEATEQLKSTLLDARYAVVPDNTIFSRIWLNRLAEAALGVVRASSLRLRAAELYAIERFRTEGALEWAAIGLVFAQGARRARQEPTLEIARQRLPATLCALPIEDALQQVGGDRSHR
jgi:hypothetical protein